MAEVARQGRGVGGGRSERETLSIGGGERAAAPELPERLTALEVDDGGDGRPQGFLAQVPVGGPAEPTF